MNKQESNRETSFAIVGSFVGWMPVHSCGSVEAGLDHQLPLPLCHLWVHDWCIRHHCSVSGMSSRRADVSDRTFHGVTLRMPLCTCLMTRHAVMHMSHHWAYCHTHSLQLRHVVPVIFTPQQKLVNQALSAPTDLLPVTKCCPSFKAKPFGSRGQLIWLMLLLGYEATLRTKSCTDLTIRKSAFAIE